MSVTPGMPLSDLGEVTMLGGAGSEPHQMIAGFAANGAPITSIGGHIDQSPDNGIASLVVGHKPGMNI